MAHSTVRTPDVTVSVHIPHESKPRRSAIGTQTVVIIGLGYVGLPLALLAAKQSKKYRVVGIDIDKNRRQAIIDRNVPDLDEESEKILHKAEDFAVTASFEAVREADVVVVCVPTPVKQDPDTGTYMPDLSAVVGATEAIGARMKKGALYILESTVNPGTSDEILIPLLEQKTKYKVTRDFDYAHCPERINPGDPQWSVKTIPRVIGGASPESTKRASAFYASILNAPVAEMETIREAEAVKMVENSFRDINIAFVNELAMSFSKLGIDIEHVLDGAATKPFSFMRHSPGAGVGGHCIPVDPYYLIQYAAQNGFEHRFLSLARTINNNMPAFTIELLSDALIREKRKLAGTRIALLGLSYKPDISDLRESPALEIEHLLKSLDADVVTFDPHVLERSSAETLTEALDGAQAIILATAHKEFAALEPNLLKQFGISIVVDGRNFLAKEKFKNSGIQYVGIGR